MSHEPASRTLTVIAQDPGVRQGRKILTAQVTIPAERLTPGPCGSRVQVVDYDSTTNTLYRPPDIEPDGDPYADVDHAVLLDDPRFHAQNCYALVMSTLARFERALGRRVGWAFEGRGHQIKIAPHAFAEPNAYYSRDDEALLFGYFRARRNQLVFTCLSHDVIVHETTHALLDGLRRRYLTRSSPDQTAFHEGFADIVAILSAFAMPEVLRYAIAPLGGHTLPRHKLVPKILRGNALFHLGEEFGKALAGSRGEPALRASLAIQPARDLLQRPEFQVPHRRGEILVAAVLDAFVSVWSARLLPKDQRLVELDTRHVIDEGADVAEYLLTMMVRALDYTPPVHLRFSDILSAVLTSDHRLHPDDARYGFRTALRDSFARFGILPGGQRTGVEPGLWNEPGVALRYDGARHAALRRDPDEVFRFLWENAEALELDAEAYTFVQSVRPCVRVGTDGFVLEETIAEYVQILDLRASELAKYGIRPPDDMKPGFNVRLQGGGTLVFDDFGRLVYHVRNGVRSDRQSERLAHVYAAYKATSRARFQGAPFADLHDTRARAPAPWRPSRRTK